MPHCLRSLFSQDYQGPVEIIVVDNNSTDGTADVARAMGAIVVPCARRGVVYARQAGFRAATGEVLMQTDADSICPPDWISRHVAQLMSNPTAVAVAGEVDYIDEPLWHRPLSSGARHFKRWWYALKGRPIMVFAANLSMWRSALAAIGGYNEKLPHCGDEKLLLQDLLDMGTVLYQPQLRIATSSRRFKGRWFQAMVLEMLLGTVLPVLFVLAARSWSRGSSRRSSGGIKMLTLPVVAGALALVLVSVALHGYFVPSSQVFGKVHTGSRSSHKVVALTFDDGPDPTFTEEVLNVLTAYGVKATFFVRGASVVENPDLVRRIAETGNELGNHSWSHLALGTPARYRMELEKTQSVIEEIVGIRPTLFRPPYGRKTPWLLREARKQQLITVGWSVSAKDTRSSDPGLIARQVISRTRPGDIVLLHDGVAGKPKVTDKSAVIAALPIIIEALLADGYQFVTVSELFDASPNVKPMVEV